jgi:protein tyrosine phosphatase (PTP) superfamily phosphohydrolase (DUF442 family)
MTSHLDWLKIGRATRGTPRPFWTRRCRLYAMAFIAGMALLQSGCQSGPLSNCRMFSSCGFLGRATNRILHRDQGCCGSPAVSDGGVEYGAPAGVLVPAPGAIPSYSGGAIGTSPSNVPPPILDNPTNLEAVPKAKSVPLPGGSGATSSTGSGARSTSYYARRDSTQMSLRSRSRPTRTPASTPEPTPRSAQASSHLSAETPAIPDDDDLLDHLPPLDLPREVTKSAASPPTPPAAPARAKDSRDAPGDHTTQRDPAEAEADIRLAVASDPGPETASAAGIGIARFASVDLNLAGGSLPSAAGLTWLAEKGYRTLVDLRDSPEVSPSFIASVANRGLRYVALPIALKTIDGEHVARFNFELGSVEARPLYFFDSDGSRPGALWYIRRLTLDKVDPQIARREAEELGLVDQTAWLATTRYVEKRDAGLTNPGAARSSPASPATSTRTEVQTDDHAAFGDRERSDQTPATTVAVAKNTPAPVAGPSSSTGTRVPASHQLGNAGGPSDTDSLPIRDMVAWRPLAAMLLTGLSVPLVYWTSTAVPAILSKARASLPAPGLRLRSLPRESGD